MFSGEYADDICEIRGYESSESNRVKLQNCTLFQTTTIIYCFNLVHVKEGDCGEITQQAHWPMFVAVLIGNSEHSKGN